ncbi:mucin-5AC-like [Helicoverpa zea]|uniref:mucin-5AC-like n=1 Tax=Helicoverpa zea TaxID=7113 RepID=UPI001F58250E|nr:mucin-5AC-like [Helicoverpa zea]
MIRVAWLTCALVALAGARVYERCELARELRALGVHPDHISTWVCIAYHESRFDTAANNPHSGDHGIFQISELYWCGPGKACGLPCSALRDEDISNDLECALLVHEEHTRLQGNGFLAWVVYPQHCKHNTKKYLVDCDTTVKSSVPITRSRNYSYANSFNQPNVTTTGRQNVESLLPPYLTIGSIVRDNYGKVLDQHKNRFDWYNYKIDNIDELRLPVFNQPSQHISMPPTSAPRVTQTTTTTSTPYIPRVVPWRTIETNQFRKKKVYTGTSTPSEISKKEYSPQSINSISTASIQPSLIVAPQSFATAPSLVNLTTTTLRPTTTTTVTTATYKPPLSTTTYRPPTSAISYSSRISTTTYKPPTTTTYKPPTTTTTYRPPSTTTYRPSSTTTYKPPSTTTFKPQVSTIFSTRPWISITTPKPNFTFKTSLTPITSKTSLSPSTATVSKTPTTAVSQSRRSSTADFTTPAKTTRKPQPQTSWFTFTSRTTTPSPLTKQTLSQSRPTQTSLYTNTNTQLKTNPPAFSSLKTQATTPKPRTTQSIFDLYLNPTKAPAIPSYKYNWGQSRLKIFGGGTTPAPVLSTRRSLNNNGAARNQIKRQLLSSITNS